MMDLRKFTARYGIGIGLLVTLAAVASYARMLGPVWEAVILAVGCLLATGTLVFMVEKRNQLARQAAAESIEIELEAERRARRKALKEIDNLIRHNGLSFDNVKRRLADVERGLQDIDEDFLPIEPHQPMFDKDITRIQITEESPDEK